MVYNGEVEAHDRMADLGGCSRAFQSSHRSLWKTGRREVSRGPSVSVILILILITILETARLPQNNSVARVPDLACGRELDPQCHM